LIGTRYRPLLIIPRYFWRRYSAPLYSNIDYENDDA